MHLLLAEVDEPIMLHTFVFLVFLDSPFFLCIRTIMCIVSRFVNILCIHWLFYFLCSFTRFSLSVSFSPALIAHLSLPLSLSYLFLSVPLSGLIPLEMLSLGSRPLTTGYLLSTACTI